MTVYLNLYLILANNINIYIFTKLYKFILKKNNTISLLILLFTFLKVGYSNSIIKYTSNNIEIKKISFSINDILDSSYYTNKGSMQLNIDEPQRIKVTINNQTPKFIWADIGTTEFTINNKYSFTFKNSNINKEYKEYLNIIDSINHLIDKDKAILRKLDNANIIDSNLLSREVYFSNIQQLESNKNETLYDWCKQHTSSFICFDFIQYQLQEKYVSTDKLRTLFESLDTSLFHYSSYKKYKLLLEKKGYEIGDTIKNFKFQLSNRTNSNLFAINKKEYLYINFWSTENNDSKRNHELIAKFAETNGIIDNYTFISICLSDDEKKWNQMSIDDKILWKNAIDKLGNESKLIKKFNLETLPTDIIINKNNVVIETNIPTSFSGWSQLIYEIMSR